MMPGGGMPMNGMGGGGGAGVPDLEQAGPDYGAMMAMMAGANGPGVAAPCPACGAPVGQDGSCPACGYSAQSDEGAMDPAALAALFGQGEPPAPGGVNAVPPPGMGETGEQGDKQSLQQLLALLSMLQTQGGPPGMPPGAGGPPGMGGPPPGADGGGNPLTAAMGGR